MIALADFRTLRLAPFLDHAPTVLVDWEYLGRTWIGEAVGFSAWLRPADEPENLGALSLDLAALHDDVGAAVLDRLGLPLRRGMTLAAIAARLGPPQATQSFVPGRTSHDFEVGDGDRFVVSCTVLDDGGLTYLTVVPESLAAIP